jgi:D-alanyl-D-alanine carboxypeptidase
MMNEIAKELGIKNSNYASTHGMYIETNYSTAADVAKLCHHAMKNHLFREIVKCDYRECSSSKVSGHIYKWVNTNALLQRESNCTGIKTGVTPAAGPCLASSMKKDGYHFCIILLQSFTMESRWYEVPKLVHWASRKLNKIYHSRLRPKMKKQIIKNFTYI